MEILNAGDKVINRYLLPVGEDYCLIDTGYKWSYESFVTSMKKMGVSLEKIKYLVLTHIHADHAGFAKELLKNYPEIKLIYNEKGKPRLEAGKNDMNVYISSLTNLFLSYASVIFVDKTQCFPAVFTDNVLDYKTQPLSEYGIEFIELSGHTSADLAVKYQDMLFCGDICMNGIPSTKHFPLWLENKFEVIKSWEKIIDMKDIKTLYPAHGKPFDKTELSKYIEYWRVKGVFKLFKKKSYLV